MTSSVCVEGNPAAACHLWYFTPNSDLQISEFFAENLERCKLLKAANFLRSNDVTGLAGAPFERPCDVMQGSHAGC